MALGKQLNTWIAESESWQSFIDFSLSDDERAKYTFLPLYDDFYISLMSRAIDLLKEGNYDANADELLSIAKGLEIFSLNFKKDYFNGVNQPNNILYAASLYYLSNYPASAWILSKINLLDEYNSNIEKFISCFLRRDLLQSNRYTRQLTAYLRSGNSKILDNLYNTILLEKEKMFNDDADSYFSYLIAESILAKFKVDNIWVDLLQEEQESQYWTRYVRFNIQKSVPVWSFFPSQRIAIKKNVLNEPTSSLQMPTSSGKTSISELIIYNEHKKNADCRILYLAPYRALASELKQTLAINLASLGISSKTIYGGNLPTIEEKNSIQEVNLLISTPEKFMAVEDVFPGISNLYTTIVCDEGHLLDDESRGLSYELLLSRFKESIQGQKKFVFISAIIPNISVVNTWLGGNDKSVITSTYRPTEPEYAFLEKMERSQGYYLNVNPHKDKPYNYQLYKFLFSDELNIPQENGKAKKVTSKKGISVAVALKAVNSGTVALFAPHKRGHTGVEGLATEAISQIVNRKNFVLEIYSPENFLSDLSEYFTIVFGSRYLLTICSRLGILFHHGDFPQSVREIIEDSLRASKIRLVICTNTLAEGVNLPIKTIVIHSTKRFDPYAQGNYSPLKIRDLKNLVGRAGRAGKETRGMVIIPHEEDFDRIRQLIDGVDVEPVKGQLYNIINVITNYIQNSKLQITRETLDSLSENLQELLDSIDTSIIDLLGEEVDVEELNNVVSEAIKQTFSFYQANDNEKKTLSTLFELRTEKLKPIVEKKQFNILKHSGTNIRLYDEINSFIDFEDEIWNEDLKPLDMLWIDYILVNGVFVLPRYKANLDEFNDFNKCQLDDDDILMSIELWMTGSWYEAMCKKLDIETYQVLRLINSFISFNIQSVVSAIVRLKQLIAPEYVTPHIIANWSSFLQHGVDSQIKMDIIEMGLSDRVAVLQLADYLASISYTYTDYKDLRIFLYKIRADLLISMQQLLPRIAFDKLNSFLEKLNILSIR